MKLGLVTDSLADRSLAEAAAVCRGLGLEQVELGCGNWSPAPHVDLKRLTADAGARHRLLDTLGENGLTISALNCSGNPLFPGEKGAGDRAVAEEFLPMLKQALVDDRQTAGAVPVELRLDQRAAAIIPGTPASETDFDTEFLDYILAVGVVDSVDEAVAHVLRHSTGHSDAIITENAENAQKFVDGTDSAAVYVNVSTRFTDGGEFGLGCEMGISTQKLHARGPMGLDELCTYKYIIRGNGQTR